MHRPFSKAALAPPAAIAAAGLVLAGCARVTCDRFTLHGTLIGRTLAAAVTTDLPDATDVEVTVWRSVYVEGDTLPYRMEYFTERGLVGAWRTARMIDLDHSEWRRELEAMQRAANEAGEPLVISRTEPTVHLEILVPINQADKRFGDGNFNLRGTAVQIEGNWRVIRKTLEFDCPLPGRD